VLREPAAAAVPLVATLHNHRLICLQGNLLRDGRVCEDCVGTHQWRGVLHRCYRNSLSASFASALTMTAHRAVGTWDEVTTLIAPTEFLRGRLMAGGVRSEQIRVRSNHVKDPGRRVESPAASTTVLYVGRLSYEKGTDLLLEAWRGAATDDLQLVMVGDGPLRSELETMAVPGVQFLGQVPRARVAELMATARCLVVPSRCYEVQPLVLLEAMAHGVPAVVMGLAALPDLIDHDDGFVIDADAGPSAWAAALGRLRDDRAIDGAGHRARRRYVERHTPDVALTTLLDIYADALSSMETPRGRTRS
jgi:glycosyltransferase involved in cell wall biosynthesis